MATVGVNFEGLKQMFTDRADHLGRI